MEARILRPDELSPADIDAWRTMQDASPSLASPFFAPEFTLAAGRARRDARVAVLSARGERRGFLPFHAVGGGVGKPIGGQVCDYQGLIHAPDFAPEPAELLRAAGLAAYDFNHAPAAQSWLAGGAFARSASPCMDFPNGFDALYADLRKRGSNTVKDLPRRRRKLEREVGGIRFALRDTDCATWDALVAHKSEQYGKSGMISVFEVPWIARLLAELRAMRTERFEGLLSGLYAGEKRVSAHFGLRCGGTVAWWFTTYDPEMKAYSPGHILMKEVARGVGLEGCRTLDFGRGDQHYKLIFATRTVELCEGAIARPATAPGLLRLAQRATVAASAWKPLAKHADLALKAARKLSGGGVRIRNEA